MKDVEVRIVRRYWTQQELDDFSSTFHEGDIIPWFWYHDSDDPAYVLMALQAVDVEPEA